MEKVVVGYGRVSTQLQADGTSPEEQRQAIQDECQRKGHKLLEFYSDIAFSGKDDNRPGLQKMLADARARKFQTVMFTKLDRLGRNLRDIKNILHEITDAGLKFTCIQQPEINSVGLYGDLLLNILGAFAEFERSMISDRTQRGRIIKWKEGSVTIGKLPLGYTRTNGKIEVDKKQAEVYHRIVSMYLDENYSMNDIALKLAAKGTLSPQGRTTKWNTGTVTGILKNPAYTGEQTQNKDKPKEQWITIKYPPLITQGRFNQIQARIENQRHKPKKHHEGYATHFMAENFLFCGYCGSRLKKRITYKDNFFYCCYWWETSAKMLLLNKHQKCILKPIDADTVDSDIFDMIVKILSSPSTYAKNWLKNVDVEGLKKSVEVMRNKDEKVKAKLQEGFKRIIDTDDSKLKEIYELEIKKKEDEFKANQKSLKEAEANLYFAQNKHDRLAEFEKAIKGGTAKQLRATLSTRLDIEKYLYDLPWSEKKRITEAVINPPNGGKVLLRYGTKQEDREGEVVIDMKLDIDLDRNESLINSLNKNELLSKVNQYQILKIRRHSVWGFLKQAI